MRGHTVLVFIKLVVVVMSVGLVEITVRAMHENICQVSIVVLMV